ncbi:MAG: tRNA (N(6)-L-threonylcarbamoyladenosine(37)-C(2))-methylthiotransferase MtaB [Lachnospiraceae bacterium]|nr:tRNA (N(6)-L-threonylcarbamoyladenosine(37)-C(2))-methylthiotransferase MtaB [Lachnospiraceae bacterium]
MNPTKKRAALHNLGCKVNQYENELMCQRLMEAGYEITDFPGPAELVVINTCTVTNIADRKSRQMIHKARKLNPEAVIVAAGCYVQTGGSDEAADILIGNADKVRIVEIIDEYLKSGSASPAPADPVCSSFTDEPLKTIGDRSRAFIKIQDGCNQFCTYCIIPYARGRVVSRSHEEIIEEVRGLAASGITEFVLTGIHISSYGYDLKHPGEKPLADRFEEEELLKLMQELDALPGVERLRLSSLEPRVITESFTEGISKLKSICPHFHLSLQSGSASVLKRMNRHYSPEDFRERVKLLRRIFDDPAITTDIIAGFPGETEEEFAETLAFAEDIGFFEIHAFPYSRRAGTPAASMEGQLTEAEKAERVKKLVALSSRLSEDFRRRYDSREVEFLCEEIRGDKAVGHTREYIELCIPARDMEPGSVIRLTKEPD